VLIVGAGPAGLATALELAERGVQGIEIIDRDDAPGGLPRFCGHLGFGWGYAHRLLSGPGFVRYLLNRLAVYNIPISLGTTMLALSPGPRVEITGPEHGFRTINPKAVILATGIREANRGNRLVAGARPQVGVLTTGQLQQIVSRRVALPPSLRRLVVIGTEHVAFSAIWTAREAGLKVISLLGAEDRVLSFKPAAWAAKAFSIEIQLGCRNLEIEGDAEKVSAVSFVNGRDRRRMACDGVVFTASWIPEVAAFGIQGPAIDERTRGPIVDQAFRTSVAGVFAAGNVLHPVETSGWAALEGRRAAGAVKQYLDGRMGAEQGRTVIRPGSGLKYVVPQRWDLAAGAAEPIKPSLRASADAQKGRIVIEHGTDVLWRGPTRSQLRERRLDANLASLTAVRSDATSVQVSIEDIS
jgi:thioredoxin reductase